MATLGPYHVIEVPKLLTILKVSMRGTFGQVLGKVQLFTMKQQRSQFFSKIFKKSHFWNPAPKSRDPRPQKLVCLKAYELTHRMQQLLFSYRVWFSSDTHLKNQKFFLFGSTGPKSRDWRPKIYLYFEDLIEI